MAASIVVNQFMTGNPTQPGKLFIFRKAQEPSVFYRCQEDLLQDILGIFPGGCMQPQIGKNRHSMPLIQDGGGRLVWVGCSVRFHVCFIYSLECRLSPNISLPEEKV